MPLRALCLSVSSTNSKAGSACGATGLEEHLTLDSEAQPDIEMPGRGTT